MSFGPGQDLVTARRAGAAWQANYTAKMYHQPDDEFSPDWVFTGMVEDAELLHAVASGSPTAMTGPNWSHDSEFAPRATSPRASAVKLPRRPPPLRAGQAGERG